MIGITSLSHLSIADIHPGRIYSASFEVRRNLGALIHEVQFRRAGKPVAAIVDIPLVNKVRLLEETFDDTVIS
ncbi:MAG: hypothetical protein ACE5HN_11145 [Nitrospiria bacterium]